MRPKSLFLVPLALVLVPALFTGRLWAQFDYYVPQVVDGRFQPSDSDFLRSTFQFVNLSDREAQVRLRLVADDDQPFSRLSRPIAPGGGGSGVSMLQFAIPAQGATRVTTINGPFSIVGWAKIESTELLGVMVLLQFIEPATGRPIASTSVLPDPPTTAFSNYLTMGYGQNHGLALLNPSSTESADVEIQLRRHDGEMAGSRRIVLGPGKKIAQFYNEGELFTDLEIFHGSAQIRSNVPLAVMTIQVDGATWNAARAFPPSSP